MMIIMLLLMGLSASAASFFLKKSTNEGLSTKKLILNPCFYWGGGLYVFSTLLSLYLLKQLPYSIVIPLGSLTYVWTLIIAHYFLEEAVTKQKILGILFILVGVGLLLKN